MFDVTCYNSFGEVVRALTQWDKNTSLKIKLAEFPLNSYEKSEFHFCNKNSTEAFDVASIATDEEFITIPVPNELLQEASPITLYIYTYSDDYIEGKTTSIITIPVRGRIKPSDYKYTETILIERKPIMIAITDNSPVAPPENVRIMYPKEDGWYEMGEDGAEVRIATLKDLENFSPIKNITDGDAEGSIEGITSEAIGENSFAFGYLSKAGQKGFKLLGLTGIKDGIGIYTLDSVDGIEIGDVYSVQGDAYGGQYGAVTEIDAKNNTVTVDRFFETVLADESYSWKNIFFIDKKPTIGTTTNGSSAAFAEGYGSVALKVGAHAEGSSMAGGMYAHSENKGKAIGYGSHAEGYSIANDYYSHAEGENAKANGRSAHAEGNQTNAVGRAAHAEGESTEALASRAHAEGFRSKAKEEAAHAEGKETEARGQNSHTEGNNTIAEQSSSHAEGANTRALKQAAHAEGLNSEATGVATHAEGYMTKASGNYSHSEGKYYEKDGVITQVEASGEAAHAEGLGASASGSGAHAEGELSKATGYASHAEGHSTASGSFAHSEGTAKATMPYSHAEGAGTQANAKYSHSEGWGTIASGESQHVQGKYNLEDTTSAFIIGNGTSSKRSNAMTVDWDGNLKIAGDIQDMSGNSLLGGGGEGNTNLPFFICESQGAIIENVGYFDVVHSILFSEFDADFLPTVFAPGAIKVKSVEHNGNTVGDVNTPGMWYATYKIEFENIPENTERLTVKLLSWIK